MSSKIIEYGFGDYTNKQIKHVINKINGGKRVYYKTLVKYDLEHLAEIEEVKPYIIFQKNKVESKQEKDVPQPDFTKNDIMKFIQEHYQNEKTKKTYLNSVSKSPDFDSNILLTGDFWDNLQDIHHIKHFLSPISTYITEHYPIKYYELKKKIAAEIRNQIIKENERALEKTNLPLVISADKILEKFDEYLKKGTLGNNSRKTDTFDGLWLGFYTTLQLRDDLGKVSFVDRLSEGFNYLNLDKSQITILGKKGKKTTMTYDIPKELTELVKKSLVLYPRDYLFARDDGSPLGSGNKNLTRSFQRIFGKKITINDIRKSFTTKAFNATPAEMLRMAQLQRHSVDTAILYYTRQEPN